MVAMLQVGKTTCYQNDYALQLREIIIQLGRLFGSLAAGHPATLFDAGSRKVPNKN